MKLFGISALAALAWSGAIAGGSAARAADMAPIFSPAPAYEAPDAPLTFGTGWYLRGDAAFSDEDHPKLDTAGTLPTFRRNATDIGYGLGLGAGYKFNSFLRADITADYLDPFSYKADISCGQGCLTNLRTNVWRWDGLVNGYADLGNWFGITPYVGAGVGLAGTHQDGSIAQNGAPLQVTITDPRTGAPTDGTLKSQTDYRFAWAAMAGFTYAFDQHMLLDVGYRYLALGRATIPLYPAASVTKDLSAQQVRVGIRYLID